MSFDSRDIRKSMDVYTFDNVYLGTVLDLAAGQAVADEAVGVMVGQSSDMSGELLGPMPTLPIGNRAAIEQSAGAGYATRRDTAQPLGRGTITVGKWWGLLGRRTIHVHDVQTVSLERVVLSRRA